MKKMLFVIALSALTVVPVTAAEVNESIEAVPGGLLEVDLETGGSLEIRGWDETRVAVHATTKDRDADEQELMIEKTANGVRISTEGSKGWGRRHSHGYDLSISVPHRYDLELETMGGDIQVFNVEGDLEGETMGGDLEFVGLKGSIDFETMGGDIELRDSDVDGNLETMGGEVTVENVTGDVDGSSMGGNVTYKNVTRRSGESTGEAAVVSTMGGDITLESAPAGASLSTMGGDIEIDSAARFVEAETMGGDITIGRVEGSVEASTMGGDVTVTVVGDPQADDRDIELTSMGGDIDLTVPRNFSMEVDIEISFDKKNKREPKIVSDVPLEIEKVEGDNGFLWKGHSTLRGRGSFNGGKNKVEIETVGGDVYLRYGS